MSTPTWLLVALLIVGCVLLSVNIYQWRKRSKRSGNWTQRETEGSNMSVMVAEKSEVIAKMLKLAERNCESVRATLEAAQLYELPENALTHLESAAKNMSEALNKIKLAEEAI